MTKEILKLTEPDFLYLSGSRLYGTHNSASDEDLRGFIFPPFKYIIGTKKFNCGELEGDHKIFSAKKYVELLLQGDPQSTESLFIPEKSFLKITEVGRNLLTVKDFVLSNGLYNRIVGYSTSEWRKAMGFKLEPLKRTRTEEEIIRDIRNSFKPDKESMDEIIYHLYKNREMKKVPSIPSVGARRRAEYEKFGYCVKSASHAIRLLGQLKELMETGNITFPRPNADELKDIRNGVWNKEVLDHYYEELKEEVKSLKDKSVLPYKPNRDKVWQIYEDIVRTIY